MLSLSDFRALNFESVTVTDTAQSLTASVTTGGVVLRGQRAFISAETAQMRFRYDGTAPTSTVGHILESGQTVEIVGYDDILNFRIIRTGATSGTIRVTLEAY